jgi:hypothetical protein
MGGSRAGQERSTIDAAVRARLMTSSRGKVHLSRYQRHSVDHRKKSASDTERRAGAKVLSRDNKFSIGPGMCHVHPIANATPWRRVFTP